MVLLHAYLLDWYKWSRFLHYVSGVQIWYWLQSKESNGIQNSFLLTGLVLFVKWGFLKFSPKPQFRKVIVNSVTLIHTSSRPETCSNDATAEKVFISEYNISQLSKIGRRQRRATKCQEIQTIKVMNGLKKIYILLEGVQNSLNKICSPLQQYFFAFFSILKIIWSHSGLHGQCEQLMLLNFAQNG